ncbi:MAG TPA: GNAT family N-acetyltransferase [Pyrinomonadaceae bacterium]|nr:GNAT family N-acetyltransferase [Pyrinomonadaceae bacterium]
MSVELKSDEFARVLPLYRAAGACFPIISAVIQRRQRGQVFADRRESPASAFVVTNFGFALYLGDEGKVEFDEGLARLLAAGDAFRPSYLLWYAPPALWQAGLDALGSDLVRRRERVRFEFREERAAWLSERVECPDGFELKPLSAELIPKTEKFGVKLDSRFWASAADFVENSLGVCLLKDGEVASLCYAAAVADGLAEVDVVTDAEFRGRGLASVVTRQFIKECLRRGVAPTWDCFEYNAGSMRLAEKTGFVESRRYALYSFNVPINLEGDAVEAIT